MERVECKTQKQVDEALAAKKLPILVGDGWFRIQGEAYVEAMESSHVEAWESSHVVARESSHVVAWESSHVVAMESSHVVARGSSHVEAWESSHVEAMGSSHVVARGSSHVVARGSSHVEAWESSHVEAWESSHVVARESSHVVAAKFVAVHLHPGKSTVTGGVVIAVEAPKTPADWCDFYGAKHDGAVAILFKAVGEDYTSPHGTCYAPGTMPKAQDWDGGEVECGGGLHFCAHPLAALGYNDTAKKFVACPVRLKDIAVHPNPDYPNKIKAKKVWAPIYEVTRYGEKIEQEKVSIA